MPFWNRSVQPVNRVTADRLAAFGRWEFLREASGIDPSTTYGLVSPLNELIYTQHPDDRDALVSELLRHAVRGEWEAVGAWKYVREFLSEDQDTQPLIDAGLLAVHRMQVTNLAIHLAPVDSPRYQELTGGPVPHDGFFGPPVFNSNFGPTRQYYFDLAISAAAARHVDRLPTTPGVAPRDLDDAAKAMWDFGMLVHRGPAVVPQDIAFEPSVIRPAVHAATGTDHVQLMDGIAERVLDRNSYLYGVWSTLGTVRFAEEYLDGAAMHSPGFGQVLDEAVALLRNGGLVGMALPIEVLTPRTKAKWSEAK